jgi:hypothetical protein
MALRRSVTWVVFTTLLRGTSESSVNCLEKTAVTLVAPAMSNLQVGLTPTQAPRHSRKTAPGAAVALTVTTVPGAKLALQVAPQLSPAGVDVTVPSALPALLTVRVTMGRETVKASAALSGP